MTDRPVRIEDVVKITTYLIGLIGFLPVYRHIHIVYSVLFVSLMLLSAYFERSRRFPVPHWLLNIAAAGMIIFSFYRLNPDDIIAPAIEGLLMLLAIKFLEKKKVRDYMQIYVIAVFLLSGASLLSIEIDFVFYFLCLVFLLGIAIVLLTYYSQDPDLELERKTVLKITLRALLISLLSIPMTLFLFVFLPRTSYPFFKFLQRAEKAKSGFTDKVRLGEVSNIQEDISVIFRAKMEKIDDTALYWRGLTLDYYDGRDWKAVHRKDGASKINLTGRKVRQVIYMEPYEHKYLFALDRPVSVALRHASGHGDLTFSMPGSIERKIRYEAVSILADNIPEDLTDRSQYLQLPADLSQETRNLANRLILQARGDQEEVIKALLKFFRDSGYRYSLENLPITQNPLDAFLFKYKYGNCEYFASAAAVMLRLAKVPSRLVAGYMGGYYNAVGGYYLIPQKNAHVWVEAYLKGRGWIRLEPTPAPVSGFSALSGRPGLFRIRVLLDTIDYYWNALVINYDFERQAGLIKKIRAGLRKPGLDISALTADKQKILYAAGALAAAAAVMVFLKLIAGRKRTAEERLLSLFFKRLGKYGYFKQRAQGLEEFAMSIKEQGLRHTAGAFVQEFQGYFYRDKRLGAADIKRLMHMVRRIKDAEY